MTLLVNGLHLEPTNLCTLRCPGCARTQFIDVWGKYWKNHSINLLHLENFLDINLSGKAVSLCGNYGDPIYHPEFFELIKLLKSKKIRIVLTTNGSYKTQSWWENLCQLLESTDEIVFSVDGTPDNFSTYRINANWQSIETGMKTVGSSDIQSTWKYIPFNYNISSIQQARELSHALGIDQFKVENSDRFDQYTQHLIPPNEYIRTRAESQTRFKQSQTVEIDPKCSSGKMHYISADGYYSPCCFVSEHRFYYKTVFGKDKSEFSIADQTLSQVLARPKTVKFYNNILVDMPTVCQYNCPNTS